MPSLIRSIKRVKLKKDYLTGISDLRERVIIGVQVYSILQSTLYTVKVWRQPDAQKRSKRETGGSV